MYSVFVWMIPPPSPYEDEVNGSFARRALGLLTLPELSKHQRKNQSSHPPLLPIKLPGFKLEIFHINAVHRCVCMYALLLGVILPRSFVGVLLALAGGQSVNAFALGGAVRPAVGRGVFSGAPVVRKRFDLLVGRFFRVQTAEIGRSLTFSCGGAVEDNTF